jgi:FAD:protein FMN transferase
VYALAPTWFAAPAVAWATTVRIMLPGVKSRAFPCPARRVPRQRLVSLSLLLGLLCTAPDVLAREGASQRFEFALPRMGTLFRIELYAGSKVDATRAAAAAFERIEKLEQVFSYYREDSELNCLAREGWTAPRLVSAELFYLLDKSLMFSRLSGGAFDVTIGPVIAVWQKAGRTGRRPSAAELAKARAAVGYQNIELAPETRTVFLIRSDMKLDMGGIAKGYAADQALELLKSRGIRSALVDAGRNLALGEPPPGKPGWKIVIDSPDAGDANPPRALVLHDVGVATSGNSQRFVQVEGQRYSHIVNPADGEPLRGSASTTVIARDGTAADALATALSVLPVAGGLRLLESVEGASAYLVRQEDGKWRYYSSLRFPRTCRELRKRGN